MDLIHLGPLDLGLAAALVLMLAALSLYLGLGVERRLLLAALRSLIQLGLLGLVLKTLFAQTHPLPIFALTGVMLAVAAWEVRARQRHRFRGPWGIGIGALSMFVSSFSVTLLALVVVIRPTPWYAPQYLIPFLGMLLGNTMSGIAIGLESLTRQACDLRPVLEDRLALGHPWQQVIAPLRREAMRAGLIPIINAMSVAGVVSLPGMMTGQILAGSPPMEAAKYQLLILFLIAAGTGFGAAAALWVASRRLFDGRERLRLDRLDGV